LTARWRVLSASVPDALDDEIASVLGTGSLGVEVAASGPGMSVVRVYLGDGDEPAVWRERAQRVLAAHGLSGALAKLSIDPVADERWVERWQATLAPIPLGARFVVLPTEGLPAPYGREPIRLIPGMAFGTGEHATTRLCAAGVERHVTAGSRWLDVGTGTGILAIIAARCGAARVLAMDADGEAAVVAHEVVGRNDAAGVVDVRVGSIADVGDEAFDGIVANIQASFFIANAGRLALALADRGVLLASGFLNDDVAEVSSAFRAAGLRIDATAFDGSWACLCARRGAA
jgi:ribosomal protein L11 methyltransferase